jgi:hypothetical protein
MHILAVDSTPSCCALLVPLQAGNQQPGALLYLLMERYNMTLHEYVDLYVHQESSRCVDVGKVTGWAAEVGREGGYAGHP